MEPKYVLAFGTCASSGGFYDNYTTVPGIDKIIPSDVYIPGCPPRPEAVLDGLMLLQDKIARNERRPGVVKPRVDPLEKRERARSAPPLGDRPGRPRPAAQGSGGAQVSQLVLDKLKARFGAAILETHSALRRRHRAWSTPPQWRAIGEFLRDDPALDFDMPVDLCGVDYPNRAARGWRSSSTSTRSSKRHRVRLKTRVGDEEMDGAELDSLVAIWPGLNWLEREVFDMSGVRFRGHPDLRRILMYPEFEGHPLQKTTRRTARSRSSRTAPRRRRGCRSTSIAPFGPDEGMPFGRSAPHPRWEDN